MKNITIYIVDDEEEIRHSVGQFLELSDFETSSFEDARLALSQISRDSAIVVVSDIRMPNLDGIEFLSKIMAIDNNIPVILITGHGDVQMAVEAMRAGAYDFIEKPFDPERLVTQVRRAAEARALVLDNRILRNALGDPERLQHVMVGNSDIIKNLRDQVLDYAQSEDHVLIEGESGTGRSLCARAIHAASAYSKNPITTINCAAFDDNEICDRLFEGKNTQAVFQSPNPVTLILDDVAQLAPKVQAKLAAALDQEEEDAPRIRLIGINTLPSDQELTSDLHARLAGKTIHTPPLRELSADILAIFSKYFDHFCQEYGHTEHTIDANISALLMTAPWPGNIRQLTKLAEKMALCEDASRFDAVIAAEFSEHSSPLPLSSPLKTQVDSFEEMIIRNALKRHNGSIVAVLKELSLPRRTLNEKMARYGLSRADFV